MKFFKIVIPVILIINAVFSQKFDNIEEIIVTPYGNVSAPDFPVGLAWLNTEKPLSLKDFRGKIILLDFWTYCCINCMHIIPDLHRLEEKYKNELIVIGVHSAKFLTESGTENIRQAILRYDIGHPVVNDKDFDVWNEYTAKAWPTLVLIDPKGKVIGMSSGEGVYDLYDPIISEIIKTYDRDNILNRTPVEFKLEKNSTPKSILNFPGKITSDPVTGRMFITDSNNNRVLILQPNEAGDEVKILDIIGSGNQGSNNGNFSESEFNKPQGIVFKNDKLFVADTENHLIREIDLNTKTVNTIAGTGYQSKERGFISGNANETALNSPWDLTFSGDELFIAMAGSHQIWKMNILSGIIGTYAGNGREDIIDGLLKESSLAQTSGITSDGSKLYFADSEVSAVRSADLTTVKTIVGSGLFDFGDIDGIGDKARLQHPLGIVFNPADKLLYIADTYNNKIKTVNPLTRESKTFSGTGFAGSRDGGGEAQFNEPSGLTIINGKLYITDTNNHLIRVIYLNNGEVKTVKITNPDKLTATMRKNKREMKRIKLNSVNLVTGDVILKFNFSFPEGYNINPEALPQIAVYSPEGLTDNSEAEIKTESGIFEYPFKITGDKGTLLVDILVYYCETEKEGICKFKELNYEIPVNVDLAGRNYIEFNNMLN